MKESPGGQQTLTCPHCGLVLSINRVKGGTRITYDTREWRQRCKYVALDSPVLCMLLGSDRNGTGGAN
jgi:hypothetical protein